MSAPGATASTAGARRLAGRILKPLAVAVGLTVFVISTPILAILAAAAWQQYDPGSLRVIVHEFSALAEADDAGGVVENVMATLRPADGRPG